MSSTVNINIHQFHEQFQKEYQFLYDHNDRVAGFHDARDAFDDFVKAHPDFVREYALYRGDFISSDREAAAFMFALEILEGGRDV